MTAGKMQATPDDYSYCAEVLRKADRDRYLVALSAGGAAQRHLLALYAFNLELLRIPDVVTEPQLRLIRMQWWRETLDFLYDGGQYRSHQVIRPLAAAIRERRLSRDLFFRLLQARERDLERPQPADLASLLDCLEDSLGALTGLSLEILDARDVTIETAATRAAQAYALQGLVRSLAHSTGTGGYALPAAVLAAHGLRPETLADSEKRPALAALSRDFCGHAKELIAQARGGRRAVPRRAVPVLSFARLAEIGIRDLEAAGWDPFDPRAHRYDAARLWRLFLGKLLNRY